MADNNPNGPRATAALIVSVVLLCGSFALFVSLLVLPPAVGKIEPPVILALAAYLGGIMAGITLMLRYWFPSPPRGHYRDTDRRDGDG